MKKWFLIFIALVVESGSFAQNLLNANLSDADMQNRAMYYNFLFKERHLTVPPDYELAQSDFDELLSVANSGTSSSLDAYLKLLYYSPQTAAMANNSWETNPGGRNAETFMDTLPPNLVPNNSFETFSGCPDSGDQIYKAPPWFRPTFSSDYFNQCDATMFVGVPKNVAGYQFAKTGVAYAGVIVYAPGSNYREYISAPLSDSLQAGKKYYAEMYVSKADSATCSADGMGIYFSVGPVDTTGSGIGPLPFVPQVNNPSGNIITDTLNWTKVSGTFTASGGENYITIGNFKDSVNTNTSGNCGSFLFSYYYIDDVLVREDTVQGIEHSKINRDNEGKLTNNIPNPFSDKAMVKYFVPLNAKRAELIVYDVIGRQRNTYKLTKGEGQVTVSADNLGNGIYFYSLVVDGKRMETRKMVVVK